MAQKFLTDIELTRGLKDSSGDLGSSGQVLSSTGTGLNWITNAATASVVYQDSFTGNGTTTLNIFFEIIIATWGVQDTVVNFNLDNVIT